MIHSLLDLCTFTFISLQFRFVFSLIDRKVAFALIVLDTTGRILFAAARLAAVIAVLTAPLLSSRSCNSWIVSWKIRNESRL